MGGLLEEIGVYGIIVTQGVWGRGPQPPEAEIFEISMFRTLWNALEKLKFKEIYQLKVPIYTLKIIESSNIFSSLYIMTMMIAYQLLSKI